MRNRTTLVLLTAGLLLFGAGSALAAGFNIYEAGVRATALGGAFTASADDGSAMFYNAAGLSFQEGRSASINLMPINPRMKFQGATTMAGEGAYEEVKNKWYLVPGAYYTSTPSEKLSYGLGVYAPFGLGVEWLDPDNFVGRQVSYDVEIQTVYVTPAISYMVSDDLALAIGLDVATQHLTLSRQTPHPTLGGQLLDTTIEGSSNLNITPTLGLMYRPTDKVSFGLMYHHEKTLKYEEGEATLGNALSPGDPGYVTSTTLLQSLGGSEQILDSELNLPYILSLGGSYQFTERFRAEANYVRFGWSAFKSLTLDFENDNLDQTIHFDYQDSWQIRVGLDYVAIPDRLNLMAGYVHDKTPQPLSSVSPLLPDGDRNDYSIGLQYFKGNWDFNLAYMFVLAEERTNIENGQPANPDPAYPVGTYSNVANIFGAGFGYRF
jgi:long-chain fatty acid transport protein